LSELAEDKAAEGEYGKAVAGLSDAKSEAMCGVLRRMAARLGGSRSALSLSCA
jgi:hypothetical protein